MRQEDLLKKVNLMSVFADKEKELTGKEILQKSQNTGLNLTEEQYQILIESLDEFPKKWEQYKLVCPGIKRKTGDLLPAIPCFVCRDEVWYLVMEWIGAPFTDNTRVIKFNQ